MALSHPHRHGRNDVTEFSTRAELLPTGMRKKAGSGLLPLADYDERIACGPELESHRMSRVGNPAVIGYPRRPVALRPFLSKGVPFANEKGSLHTAVSNVN
jgi:hypothetical protein